MIDYLFIYLFIYSRLVELNSELSKAKTSWYSDKSSFNFECSFSDKEFLLLNSSNRSRASAVPPYSFDPVLWEMATQPRNQRVLVVLEIAEGCAKKDLEDITVTVKTKSGDEITVLSFSEPNDTGMGRVVVCL